MRTAIQRCNTNPRSAQSRAFSFTGSSFAPSSPRPRPTPKPTTIDSLAFWRVSGPAGCRCTTTSLHKHSSASKVFSYTRSPTSRPQKSSALRSIPYGMSQTNASQGGDRSMRFRTKYSPCRKTWASQREVILSIIGILSPATWSNSPSSDGAAHSPSPSVHLLSFPHEKDYHSP